MLIEQSDVNDSVFTVKRRAIVPALLSLRLWQIEKHAKSNKTRIIGANFILVLAQQDKIFVA